LAKRMLPLPVLDGSQFWTDQLWRQGYHLQRHALSGRCRVISPRRLRVAVGDWETCSAALERLGGPLQDHEQPPQHVAVLLHGLLRTRRCMRRLEKSLFAAGLSAVIRFDYASTRQP